MSGCYGEGKANQYPTEDLMMATTTTGTIRLNIVDGTRQPVRGGLNLLVRVLDGNKQPVATQWVKGPTVPIMGLQFHDSPADWYTMVVHADGYQDGGIYPVRLQAGKLIDAYVMLLPSGGSFHFPPIETVQADGKLYQFLANGTQDVVTRYHTTLENQPLQLGALFTIGTAIKDIPLDDMSSPLDYYWEVVWDLLMPDRFWAWVDARLADRIATLAALHSFAEEQDAAGWHPGIPGRVLPATRSWKQTRFDVTNVQLTFHEGNTRNIPRQDGTSVSCVIVEPDIDYYKDILAHGLLEVLPNLLTGGKTDPRQDYSLRWMATKLEGVKPNFNPPCTIE
jgi:hypothetical protein